MLDTTTKKRKQTHLDEPQKWQIAKYCIESKVVTLGKDGKFSNWRVQQSKSAEEINQWNIEESIGLPKLSSYHTKNSIDFYNLVADLTQNLPTVPPQQETVEADMLKAEIARLKSELSTAIEKITKAEMQVSNYKERFSQIRKLVTT